VLAALALLDPDHHPAAVDIAYLERNDFRHRVAIAIANSRLIAFDRDSVSFKYKDYRVEGPDRYKMMTLATDEFIRRFLIHVLPKGFHRHPPLRPVRQGRLRRQHRTRPPTAR